MRARRTIAVLVGTLLGAAGAEAASLRAGGMLADGPMVVLPEASPGVGARLGLGDPDLRLGFTPRAGSALLLDPGEGLGLRLGLGPLGDGLGRLDGLGVATLPTPLGAPAGETAPGLAIGGALAWSGWSVGGSYSSGAIAKGSLDLWTGQLGYGPVTARLGYGQEASLGRVERELWLFGTEVATGPWLTLEGDVAVTTQTDREPTTVGRVGLRLNF